MPQESYVGESMKPPHSLKGYFTYTRAACISPMPLMHLKLVSIHFK
ncbi:hypothetical protein AB205_0067290 [Aquarana catesbeiana]|uniref:Uncharacterized protein n=1 Tax=Aquarana catesbeiana TaxID=8400 RepID=A0A2G9SBP2_AQUCT|nr:hypothetical protein AB205_0067290 [Aquarana catesbeiana]PIO37476.1 hypothetical protein AB205_0067290 [Aquarana catesbeiana]